LPQQARMSSQRIWRRFCAGIAQLVEQLICNYNLAVISYRLRISYHREALKNWRGRYGHYAGDFDSFALVTSSARKITFGITIAEERNITSC